MRRRLAGWVTNPFPEVTMHPFPVSGVFDATQYPNAEFANWFYGSFITASDRVRLACRAARAAAKAIQVRHDAHAAAIQSPDGRAECRTSHLVKVSAKLRRNADPQARAQAIDDLNAPIIQARRMASLQAIAIDIGHKKGLPPPTLQPLILVDAHRSS
jgi:hypothetical protein